MIHGYHMVHIRPPCVHHWHLSTCPTLAPRLVFWHRRNWCQVSVARRWQIASHQLVLQFACQNDVFSKVWRVWNHWVPFCQLDLWLVAALCLASYEPSSHQSQFHAQVISIVLDPLRNTWLVSTLWDASMKQAVTSWLQTHHTDFLYTRIQALVPWWDRSVNVSGKYWEVWCVPSPTLVVRWSQNKVFSIRICKLTFWNSFV